MNIAGIICEYNPFHRGHEWMLQQLREQGMDGIVCAMSGNFVQRGEFALLDKQRRAEMAVRCGADLVLELPTPYAAATAEVFALGGAALLQQTGVVTHLAFGSECGDVSLVQRAAQVLSTPAYAEALRAELSRGDTFAVCRQRAAAQLGGEDVARILDGANNNLGVEYCRALQTLESSLQPITVLRRGAMHDGGVVEGIASASHIRALLRQGNGEEALSLLPDAAAEVLRREMAAGRACVDMQRCERAILSYLRRLSEEDWLAYDGGGEGLYHRVYRAVQKENSLAAILEAAKTKRYTHARLRRMVLAAYLQMPTTALPQELPYLRVLAANETGRALLRQMRESGAPVLTKAADVAALGAQAQSWFDAEARRTDLYALGYPDLQQSGCGSDWRITPKML